MKILYCHDNVYTRNAETKNVFSAGQFGYEYWTRFTAHFDHITILGRGGLGQEGQKNDQNMTLSSGSGVDHILLPNMNSAKGLLKYAGINKKNIKAQVAAHDGIILRAYSEIGWIAFQEAKRLGKPIALEVSGCPFENAWHYGSILGKIYAPLRFLRMRHQAKRANAAIYVTQNWLQRRYPTRGIQAAASNVNLKPPETNPYLKRPQEAPLNSKEIVKIGIIGNLSNKLKGVELAIQSLAQFDQLHLHVLGPGHTAIYSKFIDQYNLRDRVCFEGVISSQKDVFNWLDTMDIYIQPSLHEGVPRALIEGMSRGLPSIGSNAGGIPELLKKDWLVRKGCTRSLMQKIKRIISLNEAELIEASNHNFKTAKKYDLKTIKLIRENFWSQFHLLCEKTLNSHSKNLTIRE